jgi:serine/threonine protein kinase
MVIKPGNFDQWQVQEHAFPRSGQGQLRLVKEKSSATEERFVLKRLRSEQVNRLGRVNRFEQEIEVLRSIDHPNILRIVDSGQDDKGRAYLVTPFCSGGALANRKIPVGSTREVLRIFLGICDGIAVAHDGGVIHRDLKPENIFLTADGGAIVGDFGLCFLLDDMVSGDDRITEEWEVAASRWFGAPELRNGRLNQVTASADVYSLGKLLHWMFTGKRYDRENHRDEEFLVQRGYPDRREGELIHQLLDRMIVEEPTARYQNGALVREAIMGIIGVLEAGGRPIVKDFAHRCSFCGQGQYVFFNGSEDSRANQGVSYSWGLQVPLVEQKKTTYSNNFFMLAVCNKCSHVQFFRPDLIPGADELWRRKSGSDS